MTTLESKLRALVARWRGATKAFSADGASRPLEWEGKDILRVCADDLEALLAERQPLSDYCFECDDTARCASAEMCYAHHEGYPKKAAAEPSSETGEK